MSTYTAPTSKARIREVIEWVGLTGREQSKVRTYSHGMRARLALAQALLPKPELLILDEPSDGLDPEGIHEMRQTILRLQRELGLTILLSSHLLNEVEQLCTRIAVLQQGKKVFEGNVADVKAARGKVALKTSDFAGADKAAPRARPDHGHGGGQIHHAGRGPFDGGNHAGAGCRRHRGGRHLAARADRGGFLSQPDQAAARPAKN